MAKLIMTVDDSASVRQMVSFTLNQGGYEVVEAVDGKEALQKLASREVDLLITDLNMPNLDGIEVIKGARALACCKFIPIIMLTTESEDARKQEGESAGATGWIVKPFSPEQLMAVVKKALVTDVHRQAFKEEAYLLLGELESSLLELEERPDDVDLIRRVFRAIHTIKGAGSMFGFDEVASYAHEVETVFDMVRNGRFEVNMTLVNLLLSAGDQIKSMLDDSDGEGASDLQAGARIIAGLRALAFSRLAEGGQVIK